MAAAGCWAEWCNDDAIACWRSCYRKHGRKPAYWLCGGHCQAEYMVCLVQCAIEAVIGTVTSIAQEAVDFVLKHPGLVIGTIVIIAGVTMVVAMGPGGAVFLVAI